MLNPKCFYTLLDGISNKTQYNHIERVCRYQRGN